MSQPNEEFMQKARRAQEKLVTRFLDHPDVTLIDVGYIRKGDDGPEQIALRIHVRERWRQAKPEERITFPDEVDGIPVAVIAGDYKLED